MFVAVPNFLAAPLISVRSTAKVSLAHARPFSYATFPVTTTAVGGIRSVSVTSYVPYQVLASFGAVISLFSSATTLRLYVPACVGTHLNTTSSQAFALRFNRFSIVSLSLVTSELAVKVILKVTFRSPLLLTRARTGFMNPAYRFLCTSTSSITRSICATMLTFVANELLLSVISAISCRESRTKTSV